MRYLRFNLSDKTSVKFKIRRLSPYGLYIQWKYVGKLNFAKYIDLNISENWMKEEIEFIQQLSDYELIEEYRNLIEEEHNKIKNTKRII